MSERVVVLCPGRGSYGAAQLGSLSGLGETAVETPLRDWLERLDARRRARELPGILEMDASESFSTRFLRAENAAPLIFSATARDRLRIDPERARIVAVGGNSMGWYSALWAAGALDLEDAGRLVSGMAEATADVPGGQLIYPCVDEDWRLSSDRRAAVERALAEAREAGDRAGHSIRYGGYAVLWADPAALDRLAESLPACELGGQEYPLRLAGNGPFHSALMGEASARGQEILADLRWAAPEVPLIDGQGVQWRPISTDPDELADYTLGVQVTETFDFSATVRVALREYAPDRIVLLGPGDTLGGAVAQVVIRERWRGIVNREVFVRRQRERPFLVSMARPEQAGLVS